MHEQDCHYLIQDTPKMNKYINLGYNDEKKKTFHVKASVCHNIFIQRVMEVPLISHKLLPIFLVGRGEVSLKFCYRLVPEFKLK